MTRLRKANFLVVLNSCSMFPLDEGKQSLVLKETSHVKKKLSKDKLLLSTERWETQWIQRKRIYENKMNKRP